MTVQGLIYVLQQFPFSLRIIDANGDDIQSICAHVIDDIDLNTQQPYRQSHELVIKIN